MGFEFEKLREDERHLPLFLCLGFSPPPSIFFYF